MPPRRRIAPMPVNTTAMTSMALHKIMKEQRNLLKKAATRKRMTSMVKNMIVNMYANALARQRPSSLTAHNVRSAIPRGKNLRGPNLRKRLFGNNNKK